MGVLLGIITLLENGSGRFSWPLLTLTFALSSLFIHLSSPLIAFLTHWKLFVMGAHILTQQEGICKKINHFLKIQIIFFGS